MRPITLPTNAPAAHQFLPVEDQDVAGIRVDVGVVDFVVGGFLLADEDVDAQFVQVVDLADR